jgi:hypothetical protein
VGLAQTKDDELRRLSDVYVLRRSDPAKRRAVTKLVRTKFWSWTIRSSRRAEQEGGADRGGRRHIVHMHEYADIFLKSGR